MYDSVKDNTIELVTEIVDIFGRNCFNVETKYLDGFTAGDKVRVTVTKIEPEPPRCFHCGGKLEQNGASITENWHQCTQCFLSGPVSDTAYESLQWWNDQLAQRKRIHELEDDRERLLEKWEKLYKSLRDEIEALKRCE